MKVAGSILVAAALAASGAARADDDDPFGLGDVSPAQASAKTKKKKASKPAKKAPAKSSKSAKKNSKKKKASVVTDEIDLAPIDNPKPSAIDPDDDAPMTASAAKGSRDPGAEVVAPEPAPEERAPAAETRASTRSRAPFFAITVRSRCSPASG